MLVSKNVGIVFVTVKLGECWEKKFRSSFQWSFQQHKQSFMKRSHLYPEQPWVHEVVFIILILHKYSRPTNNHNYHIFERYFNYFLNYYYFFNSYLFISRVFLNINFREFSIWMLIVCAFYFFVFFSVYHFFVLVFMLLCRPSLCIRCFIIDELNIYSSDAVYVQFRLFYCHWYFIYISSTTLLKRKQTWESRAFASLWTTIGLPITWKVLSQSRAVTKLDNCLLLSVSHVSNNYIKKW